MTTGVLHKILTGKGGQRDGIAPHQLEKLPEFLDEPIAVLESATVSSAIVVLTTARTASGVVIASISQARRDGNAIVNLVTSAYAKERQSWIAEQVAANRLMYMDRKKGFDTLEVSGHALNCVTEPGSQSPAPRKILLPEDLRNFRKAARDHRFSVVPSRATLVSTGDEPGSVGRQTTAESGDRPGEA